MRKAHFSLFEIDVAIPRNSVAIPSQVHDGLQCELQFSLRPTILLQYVSVPAALQVLQCIAILGELQLRVMQSATARVLIFEI